MNKEREILKWSDPSKVQKKANQYFSKKTPVLLSTRKDKKYMVKSPEQKYIHFGQMGYQDFTVHKDKAISCECFEHNPEWVKTFENMVRMASGIVIMTCATTGRPEHGTRRTSPEDAPYCGDYYRNLTEQDFLENCDMDKFLHYEFSSNSNPADLYFWGLCKP